MNQSSEFEALEDRESFGDSPEKKKEIRIATARAQRVKKFFRLGGILVGALFFCVSLAYLVDARLTSGRVVSGVTMAGIDVSRLSAEDARNRLRASA